jgi:hypothetical protein
LSHLYAKTIILPRQARDEHRENSKKDRFSLDYLRLALAVDGAAARAVLGRVSDGKCADCAERNVSVVRRAREDLATIIEEGQLGV